MSIFIPPNDSTRIADESSLLIMDIVVQLEDGSIANVECQRIGYKFPGQRAACYSADSARKLFENGVSYEVVRTSIAVLNDDELQCIYKEVK